MARTIRKASRSFVGASFVFRLSFGPSALRQAQGKQAQGMKAQGMQAQGMKAQGMHAQGMQAQGKQGQGMQAQEHPQGQKKYRTQFLSTVLQCVN